MSSIGTTLLLRKYNVEKENRKELKNLVLIVKQDSLKKDFGNFLNNNNKLIIETVYHLCSYGNWLY